MTLIFERLEEIDIPDAPRPVHLAVGTFDGVHQAHAALLGRTIGEARATGALSLVFTFRNHPRSIITPEQAPKILTPWPLKKRLLESLGLDVIVGLEFSREFASIEARDFVTEVLVKRCRARVIHSGWNFRFGRGGYGGPGLLEELSGELHYRYERMEPIKLVGRRISSSRVREEIAAGDVSEAAELLARPHQVSGRVVTGEGIGRTIGFPTANLVIDAEVLLPADGVYAVIAFVGNEPEGRAAMMNIGWRPTVDGRSHRTEVHLIGYSGELNGKVVTVQFMERMRGEERFASVEALGEQLARDRDRALEMLRDVRTKRY